MKPSSIAALGRKAVLSFAVLSMLTTLVACKRDAPTPPAAEAKKPDEPRVLYYYDPMRPEVHFDKPGPSPFMDMALVPKFADANESAGIAVSSSIVQSLGIRIGKPKIRSVRPSVRVPARVASDARGQARLQSRVNGWVERLAVRAVGQSVSAGTVVVEIYSPELVQAQEELLLGADTAVSATERLRRFGIADSDIRAIRRAGKSSRRLPLRAPVDGIVTELGVREGSSVSPDSLIADFSSRNAVWIEAQLFPAQRVMLGEPLSARFTVPGAPGREWLGENGTWLPLVDPVTQTQSLRFAISDARTLPLGSLLDAVVEGQPRADVLLVPVSAAIRTAHGDRMLLQRANKRFVPTAVELGHRYGNEVEVVSGLVASDRFVSSGQFLLDAEASLQSGLEQMGDGEAPAADASP